MQLADHASLLPPRRKPHPALFMPEILLLILEHVLRPSLEALRLRDRSRGSPSQYLFRCKSRPSWINLLLVCRVWYSVSRSVRFRCATLTMDGVFFSCPIRFPHPLLYIDRLNLSISASNSWIHQFERIDQLLAQLGHLMDPNLAVEPAAHCRPQLRELCLTNLQPMRHLCLILDIDGLSAQLTLLELSFWNFTPFPVHRLWPLPKTAGQRSLHLPNLRHLVLQGVDITSSPGDWSDGSTLCLASLHMDVVRVNPPTLQALLLGVAGPSLVQLTLGVYHVRVIELFTATFLDTWAPLCCNLDWLQLRGMEDNYGTLSLISHPFAPRLECMAWLDCVAVPGILITLDFRVGKVDISGKTINIQRFSRLLHQFLCSDDAICLHELTIPAVRFNTSIFEPTWVHADEISQRPWTCTFLKKLTVAFALPQYTDDNMTRSVINYTSAHYAKASRRACGFVVTSCPNLIELDIELVGKAFDFDTEGGLCFLGRLQHLQHLTWRQMNGLTQSFPYTYADRSRRNPWPFDMGLGRVLIQERIVTVPWYDRSGSKRLVLPVLRWMSIDPTDEDRKKKWTSLARCRHLCRLDHDLLQSFKSSLVNTLARKRTTGFEWQHKLASMFSDAAAKEGACWSQLKTFTCHVAPYDYRPKLRETGAFCDAFVCHYTEELQRVLPHVDIAFHKQSA